LPCRLESNRPTRYGSCCRAQRRVHRRDGGGGGWRLARRLAVRPWRRSMLAAPDAPFGGVTARRGSSARVLFPGVLFADDAEAFGAPSLELSRSLVLPFPPCVRVPRGSVCRLRGLSAPVALLSALRAGAVRATARVSSPTPRSPVPCSLTPRGASRAPSPEIVSPSLNPVRSGGPLGAAAHLSAPARAVAARAPVCPAPASRALPAALRRRSPPPLSAAAVRRPSPPPLSAAHVRTLSAPPARARRARAVPTQRTPAQTAQQADRTPKHIRALPARTRPRGRVHHGTHDRGARQPRARRPHPSTCPHSRHARARTSRRGACEPDRRAAADTAPAVRARTPCPPRTPPPGACLRPTAPGPRARRERPPRARRPGPRTASVLPLDL
jgi:hypothetical protein